MGAYHTIDLELQRKFTLAKQMWDSIALERVETATNPAKTADVAAIIMSEGLAHICLITSSMTIIRQRIEANIPRKRRGSSALHDKVRTITHMPDISTFLSNNESRSYLPGHGKIL